ncbi:MAG: hypothetical protein ACOZBL_04720 [Patescibacteria group bacterium]
MFDETYFKYHFEVNLASIVITQSSSSLFVEELIFAKNLSNNDIFHHHITTVQILGSMTIYFIFSSFSLR